MTEPKNVPIRSVHYDPNQAEVLEWIGLVDPHKSDSQPATLSLGELNGAKNKKFREFRATWSVTEKHEFNRFDAENPLSREDFKPGSALMRIALKYRVFATQWTHILEPGFPTPKELEARLDFTIHPDDDAVFSELMIDLKALEKELSPEEWQLFSQADLDPEVFEKYATATILLLRHFIRANKGQSAIKLSLSEWRATYDALMADEIRSDSADSTWSELLLILQSSLSWGHGPWQHALPHIVKKSQNEFWETLVPNFVKEGLTEHVIDAEGVVRFMPGDLTITASGIRAYLNDPEDFYVAPSSFVLTDAESEFQSLNLKLESVWPLRDADYDGYPDKDQSRPYRASWFSHEAYGRNFFNFLTVEALPGAKITAVQNIAGGKIVFPVGAPLLKFEGLKFVPLQMGEFSAKVWEEMKMALPFSRIDAETGEYETLVDLPWPNYEGLTPIGLTVLKDRIHLAFKGEADDDDLLKYHDDDIFLLDVTGLIVQGLGSHPTLYPLRYEFFDEDGRLKRVPLQSLQQAVLRILEDSESAGATEPMDLGQALSWMPHLPDVEHRLQIDNVNVDLTALLTDVEDRIRSSPGIDPDMVVTSFHVSNAKIAGTARYNPDLAAAQGDWFIEGQADVDLGLIMPQASAEDGSSLFKSKLYFHYDALLGAGYAELRLPQVRVHGVSAEADDLYGGRVTVGFSLDGFSGPQVSDYHFDEVLKGATINALIEVQRQKETFLVAAAEIQTQAGVDESLSLEQLLIQSDIVFSDGKSGLAAIVTGGRFIQFKKTDKDTEESSAEFEIGANTAFASGLANFFGKGVGLEIRIDEDGVYHIKPFLDKAALKDDMRLALEDVSGEITVVPILKENGEIDHFNITTTNLSVSIPDIEIIAEDKVVRGRTKAVLNGEFTSKAPNLGELLLAGKDWEGNGTFRLKRKDNLLHITDDTGQSFRFYTDEIDTVFEIKVIQFNPLKGGGRLTEIVKTGEISYENPDFKFWTSLQGSVSVGGHYPLMRMYALLIPKSARKKQFATQPADKKSFTDAPVLKMPPGDEGHLTPYQKILQKFTAPVVDEMKNSTLLEVDPAYLVSDEFDLEELLASLDVMQTQFKRLRVAPGLDYKRTIFGRKIGRFPLLAGFWRIFNPAIREGTEITTEAGQAPMQNGRLNDFEMKFSSPIRFLGLRVHGFGIESSVREGVVSENKRIFVRTNFGKIDVFALARLIVPKKKMQAFEARLKELGLSLAKNEIPATDAELAIFMRAAIDVFEIEAAVQKAGEKILGAFTPDEFKTLTAKELKSVWQKVLAVAPPIPRPVKRDKAALAQFLNDIAEESGFVDHMTRRISAFPEKWQGIAAVHLREIQRLWELSLEEKASDHELDLIGGYQHKILRFLIRQYLPYSDFVDFDTAEGEVTLYGTPQKGDYAWAEFKENGTMPVTIKIIFDRGRIRVEAAHQPGEELQNLALNVVAPEILIKGDVLRASAITLDMGIPHASGIPDLALNVGAFAVRGFTLGIMPPAFYHEPTLVLRTALDGSGNAVTGTNLALKTFDEKRTAFSFVPTSFDGSGGGLYVSAPILDAGGNALDYFEALTHLDNIALQNMRIGLAPYYDASKPNILGKFSLFAGSAAIGEMPGEIPRLIYYAGKDVAGERRYGAVDEIFMTRGLVDVADGSFSVKGDALILAGPPEKFAYDALIQKLAAAGIEIDLDHAEFEGSFDLGFSAADGGGVRRLPSDLKGFIPTTLKIYGRITLTTAEGRVTISDLAIPIEELLLGFDVAKSELGEDVTAAIIRSFKIPMAEELTAHVDAQIKLPPTFEIKALSIKDGAARLGAKGGLQFGMTDAKTFLLTAPQGIAASLRDGSGNRLDLNTGLIRVTDENGMIQEWHLDAEVVDLMRDTALTVLLSGNAGYEVPQKAE